MCETCQRVHIPPDGWIKVVVPGIKLMYFCSVPCAIKWLEKL